MPTTPNMLMTLPADHDTADTWGAVLNAAFNVIDAHNHSGPGAGATVSLSSIAVTADKSMQDALANKWAFTNLRGIHFFPSAPAAVTAISGGFFISDGSSGTVANELYYRTTVGSLVQFTNGATMNSAFFVGGISGDYSAVNAQASYDDASTAYWWKQETGAAVRQWAKMQCSDLSLFEYKVHGSTPVPTFSVTLKSPPALAAAYSLTMPAALPASKMPLNVDSAGVLTAGFAQQIAFNISEAFLGTTAGSNSTITQTGGNTVNMVLGSVSTIDDYLPLRLPVGATITGWNIWLKKSTTAGTIQSKLFDTDQTTETTTQIGSTQSNAANNPGFIQLGQSGLSTVVTAGHSYYIALRSGGTTGGTDRAYGYSVTIA